MSGSEKRESVNEQDLEEWLRALGLDVESEHERPMAEQLRDGVVLCQLVNRIKPNCVETIKQSQSSSDAEENVLRFLQACTVLGVKKIFKPLDLLDDKGDFSLVLVTIQELYHIAAGMGLGTKFARQVSRKLNSTASAVSSCGSSTGDEVDGTRRSSEECTYTVRALYSFSGSNEDELAFDKGDMITVTTVVDGGWWEGICNSNVGWFPGNYVEDVSSGSQKGIGGDNLVADKRESVQVYHNLVIQDILDSERAYVHDLHTLLSVYLGPLKSTNIISQKDVELLTGNLAELIKWQQAFFASLDNCSKLPIQQQNFGAIFVKSSKEIEVLYGAYCANHPRAVTVLTDNSDKLSTYMESRGAASPGILALTSSLSKPFRRLEKYAGLLKELQRHLTEGHADAETVATAITSYTGISSRTQEIRKRKEMEYEMLTNPVQGFSGNCLMDLGECKSVIRVNVAVGPEEVEERFFLVFPDYFVILAVGMSLSGYEMKAQFPLASTSIKKGNHTEHWPFAVEILHNQETIHASIETLKDQNCLISCIGRQEGVPSGLSHRSNSTSSKVMSRNSSTFFRAYGSRSLRQSSVPIQRQHHWGFKSLRAMAPLNAPQLMALKERDKSPKAAKKFIYPAVKKKRSSKALEDVQLPGMGRPNPAETRSGDTVILNVVEAYCNSARFKSHMHSDRLPMSIPFSQSGSRTSIGVSSFFSSSSDKQSSWAGSSSIPSSMISMPFSGGYQSGSPNPDSQRRNRAMSPILLANYAQEPPGAMHFQHDVRKRAESVDSSTYTRVKF